MTDEALQQQAAQIGLSTFWQHYAAQLAKAQAAAARLVQRVPRDLHVSTEPAHAFRASEEA